MTARIKYNKTNKDGILRSVKNFTSVKGFTYYVKLYTDEKRYEILNIDSHNIVKRGGSPPNNMNVIKRNIKRDLRRLGVEFEIEKRDRTFGLCQKGYTQEKHSETNSEIETDYLKKIGL